MRPLTVQARQQTNRRARLARMTALLDAQAGVVTRDQLPRPQLDAQADRPRDRYERGTRRPGPGRAPHRRPDLDQRLWLGVCTLARRRINPRDGSAAGRAALGRARHDRRTDSEGRPGPSRSRATSSTRPVGPTSGGCGPSPGRLASRSSTRRCWLPSATPTCDAQSACWRRACNRG